ADIIWMARFRGQPIPAWDLDYEPHHRLDDLKARRSALDRDILGYVMELEAGRMEAEITYHTIVGPREVRQPLGQALAHFFNHHTHHRGQCHAMLTRLTGSAPPLDLLFYQRRT
ncbi:MAG: DinB family protein, partial [Pseudomonadota bacterium]